MLNCSVIPEEGVPDDAILELDKALNKIKGD